MALYKTFSQLIIYMSLKKIIEIENNFFFFFLLTFSFNFYSLFFFFFFFFVYLFYLFFILLIHNLKNCDFIRYIRNRTGTSVLKTL